MKNINKVAGIFFVMFISLLAFSFKGDSAINFSEKSWKEVVKEAEAGNKLIFVYVSMKGCHTCVELQKSMQHEEVGTLFNSKFINVHLDGSKTVNTMRASKWGVAQVPALVFLNGKNVVVHKIEGFQSPEDMIAQAQTALEKAGKQ
ncbi:MAG: thioredoxin family protein [Sphingobacteriales bacterium]|nr:MAG: thioredoxin family protein [Sphingobacteriales bacterium]